jgi:hypothetical protein
MYQLAQINIGRALAEMNDPLMHGFVSRLAEINKLAEESPGFVWRLQTPEGDATALRCFPDPLMIVNLSVWESLEALKDYTYKTLHATLLKDRKAWFEQLEQPHLVMWWVPAGHIPTIEEAKEKLELLSKHGPTAEAFTFSKAFPKPV